MKNDITLKSVTIGFIQAVQFISLSKLPMIGTPNIIDTQRSTQRIWSVAEFNFPLIPVSEPDP